MALSDAPLSLSLKHWISDLQEISSFIFLKWCFTSDLFKILEAGLLQSTACEDIVLCSKNKVKINITKKSYYLVLRVVLKKLYAYTEEEQNGLAGYGWIALRLDI